MEEGMGEDVNFKKVFLITLIVSLSISALIGIVLFLIGNFGEIQMRILLTTLSIGGFSLTALCSSVLYEQHRYLGFSVTGMIVSAVSFFVVLLAIWEILDIDDSWRIVLVGIILSVSIAHASLLLLVKSGKTVVNVLLSLTLLFITIVSLMLMIVVLSEPFVDVELYFRFLGVFAILDVLGTIVTPIAVKVTSL